MINTTFAIGEVVILKDAYFQVTRYEPGRLRLKEIPAEEALRIARAQFEKMAPNHIIPVPVSTATP